MSQVDDVPKGWKALIAKLATTTKSLKRVCPLRRRRRLPDDTQAATPVEGDAHPPKRRLIARAALQAKWATAREKAGALTRRWKWWPVVPIVLVVAIVAGAVLLSRKGPSQDSLQQVYTVTRGNLMATIGPTGEVYAPRSVELSFDVTKIALTELPATPGQRVAAGDVLARIDTTALERDVTQAEANLTEAQDNLDKVREPYTADDLAQAKLAVSEAELSLEVSKGDLEKAHDPYSDLDVIQARLAVSQSQVALIEAQDNLETVADPDTEELSSALQDAAASLKTAESQLVSVQNDTSNTARIRTLEYEAHWFEQNYGEAQVKFANGKIDQQKLDWEYSNMLAAQEKLNQARANAESSLTSAQNQVNKAREAYQEAADALAKAKKGPDPVDLAKAQSQVTQAEYNLAKAQADLDKIEAGPDDQDVARAENAVTQAELNLAKAQAALADIKDGPDPKDIEVAEAKAVSAQAALEEARAALQAATMTAPFAGTIISVGAEVGDLVSSGTIIVTLADLSNLRVKAIIDETAISQVEIGQEVTITFDAFPGQRLNGQVIEVPLQGTLSQNILTYEVPISLEGADQVAVKPGMTANLNIVVGQRRGALLIPALAPRQGEDGNVVSLLGSSGDVTVLTPVVLGLSDGMYVEVLKGLNEGDRIMVTYDTEQETANGSRGFESLGGMGAAGGRVIIR